MEVKNGIIIDGILHEPSEGSCSECSLKETCINNLCDCYCIMLDLDTTHECFVSRGKVIEIETEKEEQ